MFNGTTYIGEDAHMLHDYGTIFGTANSTKIVVTISFLEKKTLS